MSLQLPDSFEIVHILEMMIGEKPPMRDAPAEMDLGKPRRGTYISILQNNENEVRGAILADLSTTVFLGGNMIMIPVGGQEEQVGSGEASESIIDAMGEINNMLRGLLNKYQSNEHVSPSEIKLYSAPSENDENAWLLCPASRLDLEGTFPYGSGKLSILAR